MSTWKRTSVLMGADFQTREADGQMLIEGYFAVFGGEYWLWDSAYETIDPGAFSLETDTDVRALTNHDTTLVLGRTTAGTLQLRTDEHGLAGTIVINPDDQDAVNLYARVKRGDVSQCSFGFDILEDGTERREDGITVFHLRRVRLYEVSICTFPAYEQTGVEARRAEVAEIEKRAEELRQREAAEAEARRQAELEAWRGQMRARIRGEQADPEPEAAE